MLLAAHCHQRIRRAARGFRTLAAADNPVLAPDPFEHLRHQLWQAITPVTEFAEATRG